MAADVDRIRRLEDLNAIRNLIASYGPLADQGNAQAVAAMWTQDGSYSVGDFGEARGRDEIAALIESETHQGLMLGGCAHVLSSPHIELRENEATAVNYSVVFHYTEGQFEAWRVSANRWQLLRTDCGWRVQQRDNHPLNGDARARALLSL